MTATLNALLENIIWRAGQWHSGCLVLHQRDPEPGEFRSLAAQTLRAERELCSAGTHTTTRSLLVSYKHSADFSEKGIRNFVISQ